jgi:hypothetical protein
MVNVERLRSLPEDPEEELIRLHNQEMQARAAHYNVYLDELARHEAVRQGERMEELTRSTKAQGERVEALTRSINRLTWGLTWVIDIATFLGVGVAALALIFGGKGS